LLQVAHDCFFLSQSRFRFSFAFSNARLVSKRKKLLPRLVGATAKQRGVPCYPFAHCIKTNGKPRESATSMPETSGRVADNLMAIRVAETGDWQRTNQKICPAALPTVTSVTESMPVGKKIEA
jgi:hypothetical protein